MVHASPRAKLAVVDDSTLVVRLLRIVLESAGYEVSTYASGSEALDALADQPPDALVLDLLMPEVDGWQVLGELRRRQAWRHTPIFVMSSACDGDERWRATRAGAAGFLPKPFPLHDLLRRLELSTALTRGH